MIFLPFFCSDINSRFSILYSDSVRLDLVAPQPREKSTKAFHPAVPAMSPCSLIWMWLINSLSTPTQLLKKATKFTSVEQHNQIFEYVCIFDASDAGCNTYSSNILSLEKWLVFGGDEARLTLFLSWRESRRQGRRGESMCRPKKKPSEQRECRPSNLI